MKPDFHEIRDPIHGFIRISKQEKDLIDTEVFQRLRRIRQLAMAFLVYPGALHTRFDHSIGVMHIAGRICARLKELNSKRVCKEDVKRIRLAALLHDVGHGPFSHVSEHLLKKYAPKDSDTEQALEKIHEKITVDIVRSDSQINEILDKEKCGEEDRDFIIDMIQGQEVWDWQRDIVSSEFDADKIDYLLRDSYFTGVKYGLYDLEKMIESCLIDVDETARSVSSDKIETSLAINSKAIYALEQLLLARYHMTQQVYWHRVSLISSEMIIRGISLAIDEGNTEMEKLYQYDQENKDEFINNYLKYHDEKIIELLRKCEQQKTREIFNRLYKRHLFKMVAELRLKDETLRTKRRIMGITDDETQERQVEKEKEIANLLKIDPDYVIIKPLQIRNPNYGSRSYILNPDAIKIFDEREKELKDMNDYKDELYFARPSTDETSLETLQVYALFDDWSMLSQQQRSDLETSIQDILKSA